MTLVLSAFAMDAAAALDLRANEQPLPVTRDPQAMNIGNTFRTRSPGKAFTPQPGECVVTWHRLRGHLPHRISNFRQSTCK